MSTDHATWSAHPYLDHRTPRCQRLPRCCVHAWFASRGQVKSRESKVTRRGYANSGRTRQWHHHRACGGRVNVRRLLPLPLLLLMASILRSLHNTCAGGIESACTDAPDGAPPRRGTQRRTRHRRRMTTTVSSTSSFRRRRRRRRLLGRQAAGRGTTFGAGCAARRAASAPSPPHQLLSARAHSARPGLLPPLPCQPAMSVRAAKDH